MFLKGSIDVVEYGEEEVQTIDIEIDAEDEVFNLA